MKTEFRGKLLRYRRAGSGPPILWIHAFPFSKNMWEAQMAAVAPSWTTVAIDLPGFGGSDSWKEEESTIEGYAECCEEVMGHVKTEEPWIVAGLSLGGYVAFELFRRRNVKLRGLVLADTRAVVDSAEQRTGRLALIESVRAEGTDAVVKALISKMVTPVCEPAIRNQVERWMKNSAEQGLLGALHALLERPDSVATLAELDIPVLAVVGDQDPIAPPEEMETMARAIRGSNFVKIPSAAHLSNAEQPEAFNEAVLTWLEKFPETARSEPEE